MGLPVAGGILIGWVTPGLLGSPTCGDVGAGSFFTFHIGRSLITGADQHCRVLDHDVPEVC